MTDAIAERARKLNGTAARSMGDIARNQLLEDNSEQQLPAESMLRELLPDTVSLTKCMR